jgi:CRP-like cAMP-binding protein/SAM-dependent methyltransferase
VFDALKLLDGLAADDLDWVVRHGQEQSCPAGEALAVQGRQPDAVSIILDGVFDVRLAHTGTRSRARLGPGQLVAEMSFLSGEPASASVVALENSRVLALPRPVLEGKIAADTSFAARFYRSLALVISRRLRERESVSLSSAAADAAADDPIAATRRAVAEGLTALKDLLTTAEAEAVRHGALSEATTRQVHDAVLAAFRELDRLIGEGAPISPEARQELGRIVQREFLQYFLQSRVGDRSYSKPRGYAGDFMTIEFMYENSPSGTGRLGTTLDAAILDSPTCRAVRNRRGLLAGEIRRELDDHPDRPVRVASFACGPAREAYDVYTTLTDPARLVSTLLDIDFQALAFVAEWSEQLRVKRHVHLKQANLVFLALGREQVAIEPQDLIYSIGLIDYFEDEFVVRLLNSIHGLLRPGGRAILGNFHPRNWMRAVMDHLAEWKLIHRSEDDMNRLFAKSAFGRPCTRILTEPEGINLFAECARAE